MFESCGCCGKIATFRNTTTADCFCGDHLPAVQQLMDFQRISVRLSTEEIQLLMKSHWFVRQGTAQLMARILKDRTEKVGELLRQIREIDTRTSIAIKQTLTEMQEAHRELDTVIHVGHMPTVAEGRFVDFLGRLKMRSFLAETDIETSIMTWINCRMYSYLSSGSNMTSTWAQATHPAIKLAEQHGLQPQTERDAIELLCRQGTIIKGQDFQNLDLAKVKLDGATFINTRFNGSVLKNACLRGAILQGCELKYSDLREAYCSAPLLTNSTVTALACSQDGYWIALGEWFIFSYRLTLIRLDQRSAHLYANSRFISELAFTPCSYYLLSLSKRAITVWRIAPLEQISSLELCCHSWTFAVSFDSRLAAIGGKSGTVILWDFNNQQQFTLETQKQYIRAVSLSPVEHTLAILGPDYSLQLWDSYLNARLCCLQTGCFSEKGKKRTPMQFTSSGGYLVIALRFIITVVDVQRQVLANTLQTKVQSITSIDIWGPYIAVGSSEKAELLSLTCDRTRCIAPRNYNLVKFSACGRFLLSTGKSGAGLHRRVNTIYFADRGYTELAGCPTQYAGNTLDNAVIGEDLKELLNGEID